MKLYHLITTGFLGFTLVLTIPPALAKLSQREIAKPGSSPITKTQPQTCKLENSTYSAIGSLQWTIEVTNPQQPAANESVALRLKHKIRGEIGNYNLGQSNGYGSFYLRDLAQSLDDETPSLQAVLFDRNWQSIRSLDTLPQYLFIPDLGSTDWYSDRPNNREMPLGDVMWKFASCRQFY